MAYLLKVKMHVKRKWKEYKSLEKSRYPNLEILHWESAVELTKTPRLMELMSTQSHLQTATKRI